GGEGPAAAAAAAEGRRGDVPARGGRGPRGDGRRRRLRRRPAPWRGPGGLPGGGPVPVHWRGGAEAVNERVRLIGALRTWEDCTHLIGLEGELHGGAEGRLYFDAGAGGWPTMLAAEVTRGGAIVAVRTEPGNTFVFRLLKGA